MHFGALPSGPSKQWHSSAKWSGAGKLYSSTSYLSLFDLCTLWASRRVLLVTHFLTAWNAQSLQRRSILVTSCACLLCAWRTRTVWCHHFMITVHFVLIALRLMYHSKRVIMTAMRRVLPHHVFRDARNRYVCLCCPPSITMRMVNSWCRNLRFFNVMVACLQPCWWTHKVPCYHFSMVDPGLLFNPGSLSIF